MISKPSSLSSSIAFLFLGLTEAARFVYSIIKLKAIVVQWSEHRLVTSEVAGSSPVSRELPLSYRVYRAVAATQQLHRTSTSHKTLSCQRPSLQTRHRPLFAICQRLRISMEVSLQPLCGRGEAFYHQFHRFHQNCTRCVSATRRGGIGGNSASPSRTSTRDTGNQANTNPRD